MEKKNTAALVRELAQPICDELGLFLWDVRYEKEGSSYYLRVFIDSDDGISIEDCENVTRPLSKALDDADPIKEQYLKDKRPVDFVYITGETSPMATWRDAIKSIKGYHYRLTDSQFSGLLKSLGIMGIPTYMIIDKNGKQVYDNIETGGYPGDDVIKGEIDKVL